MRRFILISVLGLVSFIFTTSAHAADYSQLYKQWDDLLALTVDVQGGVDYMALEKNAPKLEALLKAYSSINPATESDNVKKALYINLYNIGMMHNLLRYAHEKNISVSSADFLKIEIKEISVPGGNIWNGSYKIKLADKELTLDNIEHDLIRGRADSDLKPLKVQQLDPRIHTAVNCAALSCPRVRETAYRPETIDSMLDANIKEFVSGDKFKKLSNDKMQANSIVYWYYDDFDDFAQDKLKLKGAGDYLSQFIATDAPDAAWKAKFLRDNFNDRGKISLKLSSAFNFFYDWRVNDKRNKKQ